MDEIVRKALLFDFYGPLLTGRQQEIYGYAYGEDMTLSEISQELQISRQAVHDILRRTDKILENYEAKLGLVAKFIEINTRLTNIKQLLQNPASQKEVTILQEIDAIDDWERR